MKIRGTLTSAGADAASVRHCGSEWSQVDLDARIIRLEEEPPKTDEGRHIPLTSELVDTLSEIEPKEGTVFDGTNLREEWMKACAACGLGTVTEVEDRPYDPIYSGLTLHDLRRSAVRNLRKAGIDEKTAMKISGHKTRSVFDRYNIVSTDDVVAAIQKVEIAALKEPKSLCSLRLRPLQGNQFAGVWLGDRNEFACVALLSNRFEGRAGPQRSDTFPVW